MTITDNKQYQAMLNHAMGEHLLDLMMDANVMEIFVNEDGRVWVDRVGKDIEPTGVTLPKEQTVALIGLVASSVSMEATQESPSVFAEMPGFNARFQAQLPPIVDAPAFTIRKHQSVLFSLQHYVEAGALSRRGKLTLQHALRDHLGILVVGGTASGKTTFANALLLEISEIAPNDRVLIIEDTKELQCRSQDRLRLRAVPGVMDMHDLLKDALRHSPKRIIVGEVRGKEAFALINAWMVGHKGVATLHANSCIDAMTRLETLLTMAGIHAGYERWITTAIDLVVYIKRNQEGWRIRDIKRLDLETNSYRMTDVD